MEDKLNVSSIKDGTGIVCNDYTQAVTLMNNLSPKYNTSKPFPDTSLYGGYKYFITVDNGLLNVEIIDKDEYITAISEKYTFEIVEYDSLILISRNSFSISDIDVLEFLNVVGYNYLAVNKDKTIIVFTEKPTYNDQSGLWSAGDNTSLVLSNYIKNNAKLFSALELIDTKDTLIKVSDFI